MRLLKSYLLWCRTPFKIPEAISVPGKDRMEPAPSLAFCSSYGSTSLPETAIHRLWYDMGAGQEVVFTGELKRLFMYCYNNLPEFLKDFCVLYYGYGMSLPEVSTALGISEHLAKQRREVSVAMFKILLARKPKNPE